MLLMLLMIVHSPAYADHIHHLWYNNSNWQDQDITALAGGPDTANYFAMAAFRTTPNNQLHVYYVDAAAGHVHQLYYNNTSWSDDDVTAFTGGPQAYPYGISGFAIGNLQYVFYVDTSSHVHEMSYNNSNWSDQDITSLVGGNLATSPLVAFATKLNNQFHVYYLDSYSVHLYQLYFNGTSWSYQDITAITGASCFAGTQIAGFAVGKLQHLFCPGFGGYSNNIDMLHIHYNNSTWVYEDVTYEAGGLEPAMNGLAGVAAFKVPGVSQLEAYSLTDDTHFQQFSHKTRWTDKDLTARIGAPTSDTSYSFMVAFVTTPNNQFHIYYVPTSSEPPSGTEVYQLYYSGSSWSVEDLTGGTGNADYTAGMAGFAIGNLQHVFYMSNN